MKLNKIIIALLAGVCVLSFYQQGLYAFSSNQSEVDTEDKITETKDSQYRETKNQVELIEVLEQARKDMVPVAPLLNKIKEGLAKDVAIKDIIEALNRNKDNLKLAQSLLNELQNRGLRKDREINREESMVISLAEFFMRDLSETTVRKIADQVIERKGDASRLLVLSGMFVDLKEKELSDDTVWTFINMVLEQDLRDNDAKELVNNIYRKIDSGENIELYARQLEKDKPSRALGRR